MIIKFDNFVEICPELRDKKHFLFHGSNIGKTDDCADLIVNIKKKEVINAEIIYIHSEELKKDQLYEIFSRYQQPNLFNSLTIIILYLNNEKINKELVDFISKEGANNFILIIKSEQLGPKSLLRSFCEKDSNSLVVACYEETSLEKKNFISNLLRNESINLSSSEISHLVNMLSNQRLEIRSELNKMITLYKCSNTKTSIMDFINITSDSLKSDETEFISSIILGKSDSFYSKYNKFTNFGNDNLKLLNYLIEHLFRILIVKEKLPYSQNIKEAMNKLRPPVFFKYQNQFSSQVSKLKINEITSLLKKLYFCKSSFIKGRLSCNYEFLKIILIFFSLKYSVKNT